MRELGVTESTKGIETTFNEIYNISLKCKFTDCKHVNEKGCAVIEALNSGLIDKESYDSYQKIQLDQQRFQATVAEKRAKDKKFGKMVKNFKKHLKKISTKHNPDNVN